MTLTSDALTSALAELAELERAVLAHSFGIMETPRMTLVEIGGVLGLAHQRVSEIKHRAMISLRSALEDGQWV
jgi:DNA-directed RNA polymerase sigma subunit (sigma70/sigma32)